MRRPKRATWKCAYGCCLPDGLQYCHHWLLYRSCSDLCDRKHSVPPHMAHFAREWWEKPEGPRVDEEGFISQRPSKRDCDAGCCKVNKTAYCHYWLANGSCGFPDCYKAHCVPPGMQEYPAQHWAKRRRVEPASCSQPVRSLAASSSQPALPEAISLLEEDSQCEPVAKRRRVVAEPSAKFQWKEFAYMDAMQMDEIIGAKLADTWRKSGKLASRPCPVTGSTEEYLKE